MFFKRHYRLRNCVTLFRQRGGDAERGLEARGHPSITGRRAIYGNTCRAVDKEGLIKGIQEGLERERQLLLRMVRRRFGETTAQQSQGLLARVTDASRLEDLGEVLLECENGEDWLNRLEAVLNADFHEGKSINIFGSP
jgi:hypothetical protein